MGLGFKSFVHFFSKVIIADDQVRFSTECPITGIAHKNIKQLYQPCWINDEIALTKGMTTFSRFEQPFKDSMAKMKIALLTYDEKKLAILAKSGLETLALDDREYLATLNGDIVTVTCENTDLRKDYLVLTEVVSFPTEVTRQLAEHRGEPSFYSEGQTTNRDLRLIKEIEVEKNKQGASTIKTKRSDGDMYCLVPLNKEFPFNFTVDCEWLMEATRSKLVNTYPDWHNTILRKLPILIRKYLSLINPSGSEQLRVHNTDSEQKNWGDIFDKNKSAGLDDSILGTPAIAYLNTTEFNELLSEELNKIEFIKCLNGEYHSPEKCTMGSKTKKYELHD